MSDRTKAPRTAGNKAPEPVEGVFRVAEAPSRDVGRGLVRLDPADMAALGVETGDVVAISGKQALPPASCRRKRTNGAGPDPNGRHPARQ